MRKMRKMRNCTQLIFAARKMRKFAPTRKPVSLETLFPISNRNVETFPDVQASGNLPWYVITQILMVI